MIDVEIKDYLPNKEQIIESFMGNVIKELKRFNEQERDKDRVEIPFICSTLHQNIYKYDEFLENIFLYPYDVRYCIDNEYLLGKLEIHIHNESSNKIYYKFSFSSDERYWGYCQCTPDMEDYRKDKDCCGHGCDAIFSKFTLKKVEILGNESWNGDEHDYWEYEDAFYKKQKELQKEKEKIEKENRITFLKQEMKKIEAELNNLSIDSGIFIE